MAKFWTWAEIRAKVESDLDLQDEDFIRKDSNYDELLGYANEAIDEAESEIQTIYEDYFLTKAPLTLVVNQEEYALPSDIYAHKFRRVVYDNGSRVYELQRIRDWKKFEEYSVAKNSGAGDIYSYFITNSTPGEPKILLVPKSREAGANVTLWYLRQANRLEDDADICDIPEFVHFVMQFMKVRVYEKEGHSNVAGAVAVLEQQRKQMVETLSGMVVDDNNTIEPDMSHYEEMN